MTQKGAGVILVFVIILIIVIVGAGGFYLGNLNGQKTYNSINAETAVKDSPSPKASIKAENYNGWEEYVDEKFGFSIKYPKDYGFGKSDFNYYDNKGNKETDIKIYSFQWFQGEAMIAGGVSGDAIHLQIYPENVEPNYQASEDDGETVMIDGQKVKVTTGLAGFIVNVGPINHKGNNLVFQYDVPDYEDGVDKGNFYKMLASMKLLD